MESIDVLIINARNEKMDNVISSCDSINYANCIEATLEKLTMKKKK